MTNTMMETLDIDEVPVFKPWPSVSSEMIEPETEICRRRFLPNFWMKMIIKNDTITPDLKTNTSIRNMGGKVIIVLTKVIAKET